jgi:hypothetical protein
MVLVVDVEEDDAVAFVEGVGLPADGEVALAGELDDEPVALAHGDLGFGVARFVEALLDAEAELDLVAEGEAGGDVLAEGGEALAVDRVDLAGGGGAKESCGARGDLVTRSLELARGPREGIAIDA